MTVNLDKLHHSVAIQQTDQSLTLYQKQKAEKLGASVAIQQTDQSLTPYQKQKVEKLCLSVAIRAPIQANAVSTGVVTSSAVGVGLKPAQGSANAVAVALGSSINLYTMLPVADVNTGTWKTENNSTPLYPSIAKYTNDDSTYVYAQPDSTEDVSRIKLSMSPFDNVGSGIIRYRTAKRHELSMTPVEFIVTLQQNTTNIATWTISNLSTTITTYEHALTSEQMSNITDYDDLYVVFTSKTYPV